MWTRGLVAENLSKQQPLGSCKIVMGAKAVSKDGFQTFGGSYAWLTDVQGLGIQLAVVSRSFQRLGGVIHCLYK